MGMSIGAAPTLDLSMIAAGGQDFLNRIKSYNDSKAGMEDALEKLGIGKDVAAARDQLGRDTAAWKEEKAAEREKHLAQIAKEKGDFQDWLKATRDAELKARTAAEGKEQAADARHAALDLRENQIAAREAALDARVQAIRAKADDDYKARLAELGKL